MGDAPLAYVETAGGFRVSEDEVVEVGKRDVSILPALSVTFGQSRSPFFGAVLGQDDSGMKS